ncbi:MAG: hypothetical protein Q8R91_08020 [Candidatus Omnitrophota bacterium]|nr:hypothetical protein [Candidatus Omnitrophota bacterium]
MLRARFTLQRDRIVSHKQLSLGHNGVLASILIDELLKMLADPRLVREARGRAMFPLPRFGHFMGLLV